MKITKFLLIVAAAAILLAACSPQIATQAAPAPTAQTESQQPTLVASGPASCTAVSVLPTPGPTEASLFPPPSAGDWVKGPDNALVTFTEYSDFQ